MSVTRIVLAAALAGVTLTGTAHAQNSPSDYTSATRYDIKGQVTGTIAPDPDASGPLKYLATRTTYDVRGNVTKVETGELANWKAETIAPTNWGNDFTVHRSTNSTYDLMNRKTKTWLVGTTGSIESVTQFSYDAIGRPLCTAVRMNPGNFAAPPANACALSGSEASFGKDRITKNIYDDVHNQIAQVRRAVGTSLEQAEVTYSYTANSKQKYVIDANGNRAEMRYDGHDRLEYWYFPSPVRAANYDDSTQVTALATAGIANPSDREQYDYDANSNRTWHYKRDGKRVFHNYDALNRPYLKRWYGESATPQWSGHVYYGYDLRGLQTYARFGAPIGAGINTTYDNAGRVLTSTNNMAGQSRTLTYHYDDNSNRTRIIHPDGQYFAYGYDGLNRQQIIRQSSSLTMVTDTYNNKGERTGSARQSGSGDTYTYDSAGRISDITTNVAGNANDNSFSFTYTPASQINIRTTSNNLYANTKHHNVSKTYETNGLNQYEEAGASAFLHDPNGNLTSDGSVTFTYDVENRLTGASGARNAGLVYDPLGRLFEVNDGSGGGVTRFLYDGDALVGEYNASGIMLQRYVHGNGVDNPVIWYEGGTVTGTTRRNLYANWQGSITAITTAGGAVLNVNAYDAYGIPDDDNTGRFGYTGQIYVPELGLNHYKARVYSPHLGRFLQTDPIGYEGGYHLYRYADNEPVGRIDPTGKTPAIVVLPVVIGAKACAKNNSCRKAVARGATAVKGAAIAALVAIGLVNESSEESADASAENGNTSNDRIEPDNFNGEILEARRRRGATETCTEPECGAPHGGVTGTGRCPDCEAKKRDADGRGPWHEDDERLDEEPETRDDEERR